MPLLMSSQSFSPGQYLRWLMFALLAGVIAAIAMVVVADPYGIYGIIDKPGFNHVKPRLTRYQEQIKITQAIARNSNAFIAGNSRAEIGFEPKSPSLSTTGLKFYNLGVPGTAIDTSRREIEALQASGMKFGALILGLEFIDAIDIQKPKAILSSTNATATDKPSILSKLAKEFWRVDTLFSLTSLKDAAQTLLIQNDGEAESTTPEGFNPLNEYKKFVRNDGYNTIFRQRAVEYARAFVRKSKGSLGESDFKNLAAILDDAAAAGAETTLVIYPYHAQIMALFDETGLTSFFSQWKQQIVSQVAAARGRHPGARISVMDFSGFSSRACSLIPAAGDKAGVSRWYWEAGHFKKELGDMMLAQIVSARMVRTESAAGRNGVGDFGHLLNVATFPENEIRISRERRECVSIYPELFAEVKALVADERGK